MKKKSHIRIDFEVCVLSVILVLTLKAFYYNS
jgi:hypothetical protein